MGRPHCDKNGFALLLSVIVVGAVGTTISITVLMMSIGQAKSSILLEKSVQANSLVDACAEVGLQQIHDNSSFTGSATLSMGQGECTYLVQNLGGSNRQINASSTVGVLIRKVKVTIDQLSPKINISAWEEVD